MTVCCQNRNVFFSNGYLLAHLGYVHNQPEATQIRFHLILYECTNQISLRLNRVDIRGCIYLVCDHASHEWDKLMIGKSCVHAAASCQNSDYCFKTSVSSYKSISSSTKPVRYIH